MEITVFKPVGIAVEDIATAAYVLKQAEWKELGISMTFDGEVSRMHSGRGV